MNEMMIWEDKGPVGSAKLTTLQKANQLLLINYIRLNVGEGKGGTPVKHKEIIKEKQLQQILTSTEKRRKRKAVHKRRY